MHKRLLTVFSLGLALYGQAQKNGCLLAVNKADNTVSIIDLNTNKEAGVVQVGDGPHEVAVSFDGRTAVVCNYGGQTPNKSLTVIDIQSKTAVKTIDLGNYLRPHGIEFISNTEVIVTSEVMKALVKVNIETSGVEEVVRTDQVASHMVAYCRKDGKAYIANIASGTVSQVDVAKKQLVQTIPLKKGVEGLDISPDGKQLWVANRDDSSVTVVNTSTYEKEAVLPAHQIAFRVKLLPDGNHAVVSNGASGNMSVYDAVKRKWINDIVFYDLNKGVEQISASLNPQNPPVPVGIATHHQSRYVYVANAQYGLVAVVDTKNWKVVQAIKVGNAPDGLYYSALNLS